jgi:hypothetical protein
MIPASGAGGPGKPEKTPLAEKETTPIMSAHSFDSPRVLETIGFDSRSGPSFLLLRRRRLIFCDRWAGDE